MMRSAPITGTINISSRRPHAGRRQIHAATMMQQKTTINGRAKLPTGRPKVFSQNAGKTVNATPVTGARKRALSGCMFGSAAAISDQPSPVQKTSKMKVRASGARLATYHAYRIGAGTCRPGQNGGRGCQPHQKIDGTFQPRLNGCTQCEPPPPKAEL